MRAGGGRAGFGGGGEPSTFDCRPGGWIGRVHSPLVGDAGRVLVVDDNAANRLVVRTILAGAGFEVSEAADAFAALDRIDREQPHAVLLDIKMPGMDGLGLLANLRSRGVDVPVIVLTGHGDEFTAHSCLEAGADAFLDKPPERATLLLTVQGAVRRGRLAEENRRLRGVGQEEPPLLGSAPAMAELREGIARVAPSRATVLVVGESGTGKDLVARRIHHLSPRARQAFVRVNCAAIPEELIESELFGHEKGAFTGADRRKQGLIEVAEGGTLFLDEIGELHLNMQGKLLRVLETGEYRRVGGTQSLMCDIRFVAATNRDLRTFVAAGKFRQDLYYRLAAVVIHVPPLRERREDIGLLAKSFLYHRSFQREKQKRISREAIDILTAYNWPGNVRELRNVMERAVLVSGDNAMIQAPDLGLPLPEGRSALQTELRFEHEPTLEEIKHSYLARLVLTHHGHRARIAEILGISERNTYRLLKKYGLDE